MLKNKKILFLMAILIVGVFFYYIFVSAESKRSRVVFMDVGQGDAALINFENGEKMLVDCGPNKDILPALGRNTSFFDRTIDYLLVTHPDLDHYGGCIDVLKRYKVKNIFLNGRNKNDDFYFEFKNAVQNEDSVQKVIDSHEIIKIAGSQLEFFSPDKNIVYNSKISDNDYSIVFRLSGKDSSILFTGDMELGLEKILEEKYCPNPGNCILHSEILKVAHHGSDSSSGEIFLSLVKPKEAVISVGKNNFGHPSLRVMRHLERAGAEIKRTDENGDIFFKL